MLMQCICTMILVMFFLGLLHPQVRFDIVAILFWGCVMGVCLNEALPLFGIK